MLFHDLMSSLFPFYALVSDRSDHDYEPIAATLSNNQMVIRSANTGRSLMVTYADYAYGEKQPYMVNFGDLIFRANIRSLPALVAILLDGTIDNYLPGDFKPETF